MSSPVVSTAYNLAVFHEAQLQRQESYTEKNNTVYAYHKMFEGYD